jgi:hypothetical protein
MISLAAARKMAIGDVSARVRHAIGDVSARARGKLVTFRLGIGDDWAELKRVHPLVKPTENAFFRRPI